MNEELFSRLKGEMMNHSTFIILENKHPLAMLGINYPKVFGEKGVFIGLDWGAFVHTVSR